MRKTDVCDELTIQIDKIVVFRDLSPGRIDTPQKAEARGLPQAERWNRNGWIKHPVRRVTGPTGVDTYTVVWALSPGTYYIQVFTWATMGEEVYILLLYCLV